jgi:hypothetical protein
MPRTIAFIAMVAVLVGVQAGQFTCENCTTSCNTKSSCFYEYTVSPVNNSCSAQCTANVGTGCGSCCEWVQEVNCPIAAQRPPHNLSLSDFLAQPLGISCFGQKQNPGCGQLYCWTTGGWAYTAAECPDNGFNAPGAACKKEFWPYLYSNVSAAVCACAGGTYKDWNCQGPSTHFCTEHPQWEKCALGVVFDVMVPSLKDACGGWTKHWCRKVLRDTASKECPATLSLCDSI